MNRYSNLRCPVRFARRAGAIVGILITSLAAHAHAEPCRPAAIGLDPALADTVVYAYETRGYGQVFLAEDTVVQAITIWRPAEPDSDAVPRQLVVTYVDSTGRPDVLRILRHSEVLVRQVGDGVHPVEYRFVFDPALELPRPDWYFFDVIIADCIGPLWILATKANHYAAGQAWFTFGNRFACGYPTHPTDEGSSIDLIFKVEFCQETTSAKRTTWGNLKVIYR